ncbi:MAG TPA: TetR/AcrR family transcriptional regulator [Albitalea sp.]|uniref:TetR/AcrR family transcriptional regulator n=1 Tax=Piscinibacter sp. TaxID=1903157 RepID=UPI002ED65CB7
MATKGERTRADIVQRSAELMNRQGFLAVPLSAVIAATGIQKGGLYRHFESREALAYAALDHAVGQVRDRLLEAIRGPANACDRLLAMLDAYGDAPQELPLPGGCPIMNSAIEADHAHAGLRARAQSAMSAWHTLLVRIVEAGLRAGEIRAGTEPQQLASVLIAGIEGAVMLAQLHDDASHWHAVRRHLRAQVEALRPSGGPA